jgi:hypothetical protein
MTSFENGLAMLTSWKGRSLGMAAVHSSSPKDIESSWDAARITEVSPEKLTISCGGEGGEETLEFNLRGAKFDSVAGCGVRLLEILLANQTRLLLVKIIL